MMRLATLDVACAFDATRPAAADGTIAYAEGSNSELDVALALAKAVKAKHPRVSMADIVQMGSVISIANKGGPKIPMRYGRVDAIANPSEKRVSEELDRKLFALNRPAMAVEMLGEMGLSVPHQLVLAGELSNNFASARPTVPKVEVISQNPVFKMQCIRYEKDPVALLRDYVFAHAKISEVGAKFYPETGIYLD